MKTFKFGKRLIGDGEPCYILFEGGGTHTGIKEAKELVDIAVAAGADAVKFQYVDSDRLYHDKTIQIKFKTPTGEKIANRYEISKARNLSKEEWEKLIAYCKEKEITFFATACFPEDVDFLVENGTAAIKINAGDSDHYHLIEYAASKGIPVILDGRARYDDLEKGVQICEAQGNSQIIIMHCPPGYPAKHEKVNLNVIPTLKQIYHYPIGYTDHSEGMYMNFAALALGVNMIEKNITKDVATESIEHMMALEIEHAKEFVEKIRAVEAAFGTSREIFSSQVGSGGRRSIVAKHPISKGKQISINDLDFKRPGTHIPPGRYQEVVGKIAKWDIKENEMIDWNDIE